MKTSDSLKLATSIMIPQLAGVIGSLFTTPKIPNWYATLPKPPLNPPSWVFGPVWISLFLLMGIAFFLVWKSGFRYHKVKIALAVFMAQLGLNMLWSALFFGLGRPDLALAEIIILWLAILINIIYFAKVSRVAAWLLVPYILWVSFATYLNYAIWHLSA